MDADGDVDASLVGGVADACHRGSSVADWDCDGSPCIVCWDSCRMSGS